MTRLLSVRQPSAARRIEHGTPGGRLNLVKAETRNRFAAGAPTKAALVNTMHRLGFPALLAYLWVMMILLGAIALETFMVYPNVFRDPPASLELTMDFLSVSGPSDFFPPLGFLSWLLGAGALALCWRVKAARGWIMLSVAMVVCEGVASVVFFWPRNEIMFVEGPQVHSGEYLKQVAQEFETWHWRSRLGFNAAAAVAAFVAFVRLHRHTLLAKTAREARA